MSPLAKFLTLGLAFAAPGLSAQGTKPAEPKPQQKPPTEKQQGKPDDKEITVQGQLTGQVTWSGRVRVTGDVEVTDKATLLIRAGTVVTIDEHDGSKSGWNPSLIEVHVRGRLLVEGRPEGPVKIGPAGMDQSASVKKETALVANWHGFVLHPRVAVGDDRNTIRGAVFAHAFAALQVPADAPLIEDCVFACCILGVEAGTAYKNTEYSSIRNLGGSPEVRGCRFTQCGTGIYATDAARPDVYRCAFYRCNVGAGNDRPGITTWLSPPGISMVHCALLENTTAVTGSVLVRDSIFAGNSVAMRMSNFHGTFGTDIDGMSIRACLFHANASEIQGDIGMKAALLHGDPAFAGPLDTLLALTPTLPPALQLGEASAARGKGSGGRDLGPMVSVQAETSSIDWKPAGTLINEWLACPTTESAETTWRASKELKRGAKLGKLFWSSAPTTNGLVDLRTTFGNDRAGWLALKFTTEQAADAVLEANGDLEQFDYSLNGAAPKSNVQRRRLSETGLSYPIKLKQGANTLLVYVKGFGATPRVGVSLGGSWQRDTEEAAADVSYLSARAYALKGERFIEVTFTPGLHWDNGMRRDVVTLQNAELNMGGTASIKVLAVDKLLIGPLPSDWDKGEVELRFADVRNTAGQPSTGTKTVKVKLL